MNRHRIALCAAILSLGVMAGVVTAPAALAANRPPNVPTNLRIVAPKNASCAAASAPTPINKAPLLEAVVSDPDGASARLSARFEVYRIDSGARAWTGRTASATSGQPVRIQMDASTIRERVTYRYRARAEDGQAVSAWSGYCHFSIDTIPPDFATIDSTDFPEYATGEAVWLRGRAGWDKAFGKPGQPGSFKLWHAEAGEFRYRLNTDAWQVARAIGNEPAIATVTPRWHGMNTLSVLVVDPAGNVEEYPRKWRFRVGGAPGPVAEWRFDETSGAVADDSVGPRNLALQGTPTWDAAGRLDGAMRLADADDKARVSAVVDTSKSFSVSAWVRMDGQTDSRIVSQLNGSGHGFALSYAGNRWTFGRNSSSGGRSVRSTKDVIRGYWNHLLGVYNATTGGQQLYVNGVLQAEVAGASGGGVVGDLVVGGSVAAAVDHLQVWPRALPQDEVVPLFDLRDATQEPRPELLAHWQFEGGAATGRNDSSSHGQQLFVGPDVAWAQDPRHGGVLRLNATGGDGFAHTKGPLFDGTTSLTIMAWVRPAYYTSGSILGLTGTVPPGFAQIPNIDLALRQSGDTEYFRWEYARSGPGPRTPASTPHGSWEKWEHVAVVYDSARKAVKLYLGIQSPREVELADAWHWEGRLWLGKVLSGSPLRKPFVGDLDDVRVYAGAMNYHGIRQVLEATD